jgi:hypothetical protein
VAEMLERPRDASEISGLVIDDRDHALTGAAQPG